MRADLVTLLQGAQGSQRERAEQWWDAACCPPQQLLDVLHDALEVKAPWFATLLEAVLEGGNTTKRWTHLVVSIPLLHRRWLSLWRSMGCPAELTSLVLTDLPKYVQFYAAAIGQLIATSLLEGRAPQHLRAHVQWLLPGRCIAALGWRNLAAHLDPVVLALARQTPGPGGRSPGDGPVDPTLRDIVCVLYRMRDRPFLSTLAFMALALLAEQSPRGKRYAPNTVHSMLVALSSALCRITDDHALATWAAFVPARHWGPYVRGERRPWSPETLAHYVAVYHQCVAATEQWLAARPRTADHLRPHALPDLPRSVDEQLRHYRSTQPSTSRRAAQADALMPDYLRLLRLVMDRATVFEALHQAYIAAKNDATATAPRLFQVALPDGSACLHFQIWSAPDLYRRTDPNRTVWPVLEGEVLTEYLGATRDGVPLPEAFFARICRAWFDPARRQDMVDRGDPRSDYAHGRLGLPRPPGRLFGLGKRVTAAALAQGREPRVLLDVDALCAGMAYGALAYILITATGMRIHEVQQIRVEDGYIFARPEGIEVHLRPKGYKDTRKPCAVHRLNLQIAPYWLRALAVHAHCWGNHVVVAMEGGTRLRLEPGVYLLQAGGTMLRGSELGRLLRYITHGHGLRTAQGEPVNLVPHLGRHGNARARRSLGHDMQDIQAGLNHSNRTATAHYVGAQEPGLLPVPPTGTLWEALL
jgi:hypothetical protein